MAQILVAGYKDREVAERTFGELLEMGVAPEDLGLVAMAKRAPRTERLRSTRWVDSGQVHLEELRTGLGRVQEEGLTDVESAIGGGIATSSFNDDVSDIEEMDDSANVAENVVQPLSGRSHGSDEVDDAVRFAIMGSFDITRPTSRGFGTGPVKDKPRTPDRRFSIEVMGTTAILGDAPLATDMLATRLHGNHLNAHDALTACLAHLGIAAGERTRLARLFDDGGAILWVTETPGKVTAEDVEALVRSTGGQRMRTFEVKGV